ncbi:hypothetical protein [Hafnia psychrotolerans]|uniref:Uncharacterized protein n=1 Tax=Hafnia psychrotolerans TaxID=1477018 RepID=A0ABQ1GSL6_9GAMM|nr:hypothetical protein [Hafnia psychrotolerans]GGA49551.1 hypothetical protein GCM10011328_26090 [Hafnia psychrotolerans]
MANWGIQTWDANGNVNNTGIVPVLVVATVYLSAGQISGSYSYSVPPGFKVAAIQSPITGDAYSGSRRKITGSGGAITISNGDGDYSAGTYTADECWLVIYLVKS